MCISPLIAAFNKFPNPSGNYGIHFKVTNAEIANGEVFPVPCGKCLGCLTDKANRWVNRLLLEADIAKCGTFVTLTYEHAPDTPSKPHIQKFLKRLRHATRDYGVPDFVRYFKYFIAAEHGGIRGRVHYHGLLFGVDMFDPLWEPWLVMYKKDKPVYSSKVLERIWRYGFVTIGEVNPHSCRYIGKYMLKQDGQDDNFTLKSMRLGVGSLFRMTQNGRKIDYDYLYPDTYDRIFDGYLHVSSDRRPLKVSIPKSIRRYIEKVDPDAWQAVKAKMMDDAQAFYAKDFDRVAYYERLIDEQQKLKQKRILHHD